MPAKRLNGGTISINQYDVIGEDSEIEAFFVQHLGLSNEQKEIDKKGTEIHATHMNPPFKRKSIHADMVGTAHLTADMMQKIKVFLDEIESEYNAQKIRRDWSKQYIVYPHVKPERGRDGTVIYFRFNCAGLVVESYREANINLVNTENLPKVEEVQLRKAYDISGSWDEARREKFGIGGSGPWPVLLPGYVMHSLKRSVEEIQSGPYQPVDGDGYFR